jgi:hypothetical protein
LLSVAESGKEKQTDNVTVLQNSFEYRIGENFLIGEVTAG